MELQRTIKNFVSYKGIGLHTGKEVTIILKSAPVGQGVVFVRQDLPGSPGVQAKASKVIDNMRGTTLGDKGVQIRTVEHILAALWGLGVDNVIIEMDEEEIPAGDGSALPFVKLIQKAGIIEQDKARDVLQIKEPLWMEEGEKALIVLPSDKLKITYTVDFPHSYLGSQFVSFTLDEEIFVREIAPSRTFGFIKEVETLRERNLIKGGSLENAVAFDEKGVVNKEGLRFSDEPVRHKVLDLMGDLYLTGGSLLGHIIAVKSGHLFNVKLAQELEKIRDKENGEAISLDINAIQQILPHRYPFLLVDKIISLKENEVKGIKNFTIDEPFFEGHFPQHPVVPGAIIVEAMAQIAGVYLLYKSENRGKLAYFGGINKAKFRKPVFPGDQLITKIEILNLRKTTGRVRAEGRVGGKIVAEAEFVFSLVKR